MSEQLNAALENMQTVNALLVLLSDPKKYRAAHDALEAHSRSAVQAAKAAQAARDEAAGKLAAADKAAEEAARKAAANDEATEKLADWESDLRRREDLLAKGNQELQANVAKRDAELRQRADAIKVREDAAEAEEKRVAQVKADALAGLSR